MNIVKLHATTSTNDELKSRFRESELPQLTTIYTLEQSQGKGQQGAKWVSEKGKNLTFSVLIKKNLQNLSPFLINQLISVTIVEWLKDELQIQSKIKWPNDILSVRHKLCGILIENIYAGEHIAYSIIGIGLNVNQEEFIDLPKAISLKQITNREFDLEKLLISFLKQLKNNLRNPIEVAQKYTKYLFKFNQVASFISDSGTFKGTVKGTTADGKLILETSGEQRLFTLKELKWIY
ncbi:biotin--[acetyl-CoA-carboxylase] ligase [Nonlabens dokdonensis]|mgnify:CR=1 FL=1|uniref:Biotin--[acetyl-CoA-carboxylase] ligase n=1 Tax=Nonlabens dokdonensis TaxID=328515 RepID=A0A1Z8AIF1_9FLAO|nr:biotin--[acetyl-CoA-carboxylase] ligase [Nonlabens dokdonensis]OUS10097.1 biotin--[acetyl-CoA-carboxylase] ligase [Nonlabens dokdonensis]